MNREEVTPKMRKRWFYNNGWYADDKTIAKWHNERKKKEREVNGK